MPIGATLIFLASCQQIENDSQVYAYVAPASVNLRAQLTQRNGAAAILKHGERVNVLDVRRRFVKVQTGNGVEGWVDANDLLTEADMQRVNEDRIRYGSLPVEGTATAYESLNVHLDPERKSPAFTQIPEGGPVEILARKLAPKNAQSARPNFVIERPKPLTRKQRHDKQAKAKEKLAPMPPPPPPPSDWQKIWGAPEAAAVVSDPKSKPAPVALESWTLIRTKNKQIGWVLSHNLMMSIPDDVAQYAEGKHITSFFNLGTVKDEEKGDKANWLWTTISGSDPFDFDSWRVFLWNRRRHRYETSYRQRDVEGYFPVSVLPADPNVLGRGFTLIMREDDGKLRLRTYVFDGSRVHLTGTEDYGKTQLASAPAPSSKVAPKQSGLKGMWQNLKERLKKRPG